MFKRMLEPMSFGIGDNEPEASDSPEAIAGLMACAEKIAELRRRSQPMLTEFQDVDVYCSH